MDKRGLEFLAMHALVEKTESGVHIQQHSPPPGTQRLHYHECIEFGICLQGYGIFYIRDDIYPYGKGDISVIYPGEKHIAQSVGDTDSTWHFITIDHHLLLSGMPELEPLLHLAMGEGRRGHILTRSENHRIQPYIQRLSELCMEQTNPYRSGYLAVLYTAILYESAEWEDEPQLPIPDTDTLSAKLSVLTPAIQYLLDHYTEPIAIDALCACSHISPVHLRRLFSEAIGLSPLAFLHKIRISYACIALRETEASVLAIAEQCGYLSLSSFNRQFLKIMHMSPTSYRHSEAL